MKLKNRDLLLYLVTDRTWLGENSLAEQVEASIKAGVSFVQLREKDLAYDEFKDIALSVKKVTDKYKIPFVINDNIDLAIDIDADGVHIGQSDVSVEKARLMLGKNKILGVSAGNMKEALDAEENDADYIGVGAVFLTNSKDDAEYVNLEDLKAIKKTLKIPVVAIGGIKHENIHLLKDSQIDGVAVISAILAKKDIAKASKDLCELAEEYLGGE